MTPCGEQYRIGWGGYQADIASIGASLRALRYEGRDLVVPFADEEIRPAYRGATLAPWPNRVVDGRYTIGGNSQQLALTEPERGHALHGLVAWLDFHPVQVSENAVTLAAQIVPQQGYPWRISIEVTYALDADGLTQTVRAVNESATPSPYGTGPHPYLVAGPSELDAWTLELPASKVLDVTPDRLAPLDLQDVSTFHPERFDFRTARSLAGIELDHAYTGFPSGSVTARVMDPQGTGVAMTWGEECPWVQVHTADVPADKGPNRLGLAVEPMTCAPDAFNAENYPFDTGLTMLDPGQGHVAGWRIAAL